MSQEFKVIYVYAGDDDNWGLNCRRQFILMVRHVPHRIKVFTAKMTAECMLEHHRKQKRKPHGEREGHTSTN